MKLNKQTYYINMLKICLAIEKQKQLLENLKTKNFTSKDKKLLDTYVECVSDVFCKYGLNDDDEPNECGLILEDLIDYLNNLIYETEDNS